MNPHQPDRPAITDAARDWVNTHQPASGIKKAVHGALSDFLANRYFGWADRIRRVHEHRRSLFDDERTVSNVAGGGRDDGILDEVARTATTPEKGRLLFQLARALMPGVALELGTSIGISAAYIALGIESAGGGRLVTVDGSEARATLATRGWKALDISGIEQVVDRFDNVLDRLLSDLDRPLRFAYVDGNHHREPTLRYFEKISSAMDSGVIVFDDIRWSEDMQGAWSEIERSPAVTIDLGWVGLALFG